MGMFKRMIRETSQRLLSKLANPRGSHKTLVLNHAASNLAHHNNNYLHRNSVSSPLGNLKKGRPRKSGSGGNGSSKKLKDKRAQHNGLSEAVLIAAKNYLPPVQFHHVHGPTAQLAKNKFVARRTKGFCQALVFSNRVILPNERVYIKVLEIAKGWSGTIRFGFTSVDPATLRYQMPKHACPDMTNAGHTWARALADEVVRRNSVIHFSYNTNGYIHYGINNQDCGVFYANVNTSQHLWFVVDVYGLTAAIELIDPRIHNATSDELDFSRSDDESGIRSAGLDSLGVAGSTMFKSTGAMDELVAGSAGRSKKRNRKVSSRFPTAGLYEPWSSDNLTSSPIATLVDHHSVQSGPFLPNLSSVLLPTAQQNIYSPMPTAASAIVNRPTSSSFTNDTAAHDYHQILTSSSTVGQANISHQPHRAYSARKSKLPSRVSNYSTKPLEARSTTVPTDQLYMLADSSSSALDTTGPSSSGAASSRNVSRTVRSSSSTYEQQELCQQLETFQLDEEDDDAESKNVGLQQLSAKYSKSTANNDSIFPVASARRKQQQQHQSSSVQTAFRRSSDNTNNKTQAKVYGADSNLSQASSSNLKLRNGSTGTTNSSKPKVRISVQKALASRDNNNNSPTSKDCPICFERPINCVLYQCGHMCTCYECGVKQWRTQSRTCPICRTVIKDVIKTYLS